MERIQKDLSDMPAMILCSGKGTRLRDAAEALHLSMIPAGSQPVPHRLAKSCAASDGKRFILCPGGKTEAFKGCRANAFRQESFRQYMVLPVRVHAVRWTFCTAIREAGLERVQ